MPPPRRWHQPTLHRGGSFHRPALWQSWSGRPADGLMRCNEPLTFILHGLFSNPSSMKLAVPGAKASWTQSIHIFEFILPFSGGITARRSLISIAGRPRDIYLRSHRLYPRLSFSLQHQNHCCSSIVFRKNWHTDSLLWVSLAKFQEDPRGFILMNILIAYLGTGGNNSWQICSF